MKLRNKKILPPLPGSVLYKYNKSRKLNFKLSKQLYEERRKNGHLQQKIREKHFFLVFFFFLALILFIN